VVHVRETALNVALMDSLSSFVFCDASTLYLNSYRTRGEGVESRLLLAILVYSFTYTLSKSDHVNLNVIMNVSSHT